jgi:microcystin-dependent protein
MDPFLGEIRIFGGNFAPVGWALCNGALLSISGNEALFSLIGTTYGGDGTSTFALPNLQGRFAMNQGQGPGLSNRVLGEPVGEQSVTLIAGQVGAHNHTASCNTTGAGSNPSNAFWATDASGDIAPYSNAAPNAQMMQLSPAGNGLPHDNMQPYLVINFIIALNGIFPSQN